MAIKRGYDKKLIGTVVDTLAQGNPLPPKHKEHNLTGKYKGCKECHITPGWLLIYEFFENELIA